MITSKYLEKYCHKNVPNVVVKIIVKYTRFQILNDDSKILNDMDHTNLIEMFSKHFGSNITYSMELKLIWRGSDNEFTIENHRNACNGIYPTITIIKNDRNYIFGFYLSKPFIKTVYNKEWTKDSNAFVFNINPNCQIYKIRNNESHNAIITHNCERSIMFWIGYNCLINIQNYCNESNVSFVGSNQSYDCPNVFQLCGTQPFIEYFTVNDIETFQIIHQK